MKRIVSVQDISCIGKCSLTVALPIISAMGVEAAVLPTAVLSTHTAFKKGFTFRDLTADIPAITEHWRAEGLGFDAVYTGYLGSFEQLQLMSSFFDEARANGALIFVDPVMGDFGKLYPGFTKEFAHEMATLCGKADIIVPNMTEACFMLDIPYRAGGHTVEELHDILRKLTALGAKNAVLTGVGSDENTVGVMGYSAQEDRFFEYYNKRIPAAYHGTGDVFASTCVGAMMNGRTLEEALRIAADYTRECIAATEADDQRRWYGVNFETAIPYLLKQLG